MKILLIILAAFTLSSCTIYKVKSTTPDGKTIEVSVYSSRQFDAPKLHYQRLGTDAEFDFGADKATDSNAAILAAILSGRLIVK